MRQLGAAAGGEMGCGTLMRQMTRVDTAEGAKPGAQQAARTPMRERIIDAATELFYAQGLRAVSAEKIIA